MMNTRTVTAMFRTRAEAERAAEMLVADLHLDRSMIRTSPGQGVTDAGYDASRPYEEKGFFASLKDLFVPDEDRYAYAEGLRRGAALLSVQVDADQIDHVSQVVERAGALDLDEQEATWRTSGWTGYDAHAHQTMLASAPAASASGTMTAGTMTGGTMAAGNADTIKVMQERLVVGKREVDRGSVRVRAYVVERPVEEQVRLHEETIHVERRPVDRAATPADIAAFQERTIEAHATSEEAVVGKEARVVEEISVRKDATDRVETVKDTVRHTKVDVEDGTARTGVGMTGTTGVGTAGVGTAGVGTTGAHTGVGAAATGAAAAVDRTLHTNVSGANPAADAPDGVAGNPPGTMASRAVDKTLGTNISGANPAGKL